MIRRPRELFARDGQDYGVLLHPTGARYNEAVNGTRASGWGERQNRDFQQTAPYLALRSSEPLEAAIDAALAQAMKNPVLDKATRPDASPVQIAYWMSDLIDITLLDFIFSQQDRIGNIDYVPYWHWLEDGRLMRRPASGHTPPADIAAHAPLLLKRSDLGDNDAGLRLSYANYTRRTQMLEKLRLCCNKRRRCRTSASGQTRPRRWTWPDRVARDHDTGVPGATLFPSQEHAVSGRTPGRRRGPPPAIAPAGGTWCRSSSGQ